MGRKNISRNLNIASGQFVEEKEYWKNKLSGEFEKSYFPYDPGKFISRGTPKNVVTFNIDGELFERLTQITSGSFPKVHMILVAVTAALLVRYTGNRDIIVGTPIDRQESENALINTILPLRVRIPGNMTFKELLLEVKNIINEAIDNQNFPIETLIPSLASGVENSGNPGAGFPLFDVMVLLENIQDRTYVEHIQTSITLHFRWTGDGIEGEVEYNTSLYREDSVKRIIRHYLQLMRTSLFDVNLEINGYEFLSLEEKDEFTRFNRTRAEYPSWAPIHELFELQVEKTPDNIALVDEKGAPSTSLSYRQLNDRANRWARSLVNRGVKAGMIIGLLLRQSIEQVCAIFAVLKSGCAYLPIDIDYPPERKSYMMEDSGAALLITQSDLTKSLEWDGEILYIENIDSQGDEPGVGDRQVQPSDLAYVIYTSGSTGKSKGTAVEHRALVNYAWWAAKSYVKNETVHFPLFTTTAFDLTVTSIFTPLITGNSIIIYSGEEKEFLVEKVFNENKVEVLKLTPVHLMFIADYAGVKNNSKIKRFIVGGEQLETHLAYKIISNFSGKVEIYNEYGPTEATVGCMLYKFDAQKDTGPSVPIGIPAHNIQIYLLDEYKKNVPKGGIGEIYIAGHGLARGYLNKPELTAERFIPNPYESGKKLFKTGDLARRLADGNIEFLGRADRQVKIRGYRIEIDEVENSLLKYELIDRAVVLAKDDEKGYKYLVAYIVPSCQMHSTSPGTMDGDIDINIEELRNYLSGCLPDFMIPSYFVLLEKLPVTVNGKIDRKALPEPGKNAMKSGAQYLPPNTELEKTMVGIWQDVMGVEIVGIEDSYFALGGDSIKAIQIAARMQKFKLKLELNDLFRYTTIKELAHHIKPLKASIPQGIVAGEVKFTPIQKWFYERNFSEEHHFNQSVILLRPERFREEIIRTSFSRLIKHHDALRIVFSREDGKIRQVNKGAVDDRELVALEVFDIPKDNDLDRNIKEKCDRIQSSIDLAEGPLVKLGLFKTKRGDYLLIVIHHLVFDGLSWRILFEDFTSLYQQMENGVPEENWEIPLKTTSYREWAEKLYEYSNSHELLEELGYWKNIEETGVPLLFKNKKNKKGKGKDGKQLFFELSEEYTEKLLKQTNTAYNTEINDILLTALGLAVNDWTGAIEIPIILEGHGREEIIPDIDITRTMGWFTSVYPVLLDMRKRDDLSSVIKNTKEMLRRVPCKGIGYGILKYLTKEENKKGIEFRLDPEISFNYLGQFDEDVDTEFFQIPNMSPGNAISVNLDRIYTFYISGMVFEKKLRMSLNYDMNGYDENEIRFLIHGYERYLKQIIDHCTAKEESEFTASDFSSPIDEQEVERVFSVLKKLSPGEVIKRSDIVDMYFLSPMQEGMLFHYLMDKASPAYFEQMSYRIDGEIYHLLFEKAFSRVIERYDVLRTVFVYENVHRSRQVVLKKRETTLYYEDVAHLDEVAREKEVKEFKIKDKNRGFDLLKDNLIRLSILKIADKCYEIVWSFHHILMDGWCISILISDFLEMYKSYLENRAYQLPMVTPYRRYIQWLEKQDREVSKRYWASYLDFYEEVAVVPKLNAHKSGKAGYKKEQVRLILDREQTDRLNMVAERNNVTMNIFLQAIWGVILGKYNEKEDVLFGAVVSGRPSQLEGVESMVGLFINAVPIRIRFKLNTKFSELLQRVREDAVASEPHHYYPLAEIQSGSLLKKNLIDHLFIFENYPIASRIEGYGEENNTAGNRADLKISKVEIFEQTNYDFNLEMAVKDQLNIRLDFNAHQYDPAFVERIATHIKEVINRVVHNDELEIRCLTLLTNEEKKRILYDFNNTETEFILDKPFQLLFEEQVQRTPHRIAVLGSSIGDSHGSPLQLTYSELNKKSNQLAGYLLRELSIHPDSLVAVLMERSEKMVESILAIWKSGGAYIPLDTENSPERIVFLLRDSGATAVLIEKNDVTKKQLSSLQCSTSIICLEESAPMLEEEKYTNPRIKAGKGDMAYVIYTSGSTGKPKGVLVEHVGMLNHIQSKIRDMEVDDRSVLAQNASQCFDISVWQFFSALAVGGRTVIYKRELVLNTEALIHRITHDGITILEMVPSHLSVFLDFLETQSEYTSHLLQGLEYLVTTGEAVNPILVNRCLKQFPGVKVVNAYGPTEASDDITHYIMSEPLDVDIVPLGTPLPNFTIYIVDKGLNLCPIGIKGEILVSGIGVGRGYLNDIDKTRDGFMEDPFREDTGGRLYKTGDIGRFMEDGRIEFFGRKDNQVKVNGFRIELGEIESQLLAHEDIREAVVIAMDKAKDDKYLCAYYVSDNVLGSSELNRFLSKTLPVYMIPLYFVNLDRMPVTPNGKIDRKALPDPQNLEIGLQYIEPRDEIEKKMVEIWAGVLGIDLLDKPIGIDDNFFQLGGHSLKATMLSLRIHKELNVKVPLADIFAHQTIREMSHHLGEPTEHKHKYRSIEPVEKKEYYSLSSAQMRLAVLDKMEEKSIAYNIPIVLEFEGNLDILRLENAVKVLIWRHESLRTSFHVTRGKLVQVVYDRVPFDIEYYNENRIVAGEENIKSIIHDRFIRPFDLSRAPLLRVGLIKIGEMKHLMMVDIHHIVCDGVGLDILVKDISKLYTGEGLPELRIQYKDYAFWQLEMMESGKCGKEEKYWLEMLSGEIPVLNLFTDYPRPSVQSFEGRVCSLKIQGELSQKIKNLSRENGTTLYMILLAGYNTLLYKYSGQEDIIVGTPVAGRPHADLQDILGMFVNMLTMRNYPLGQKTFIQFLHEVKENALNAYANQDYQFEELVAKLDLRRDLSRNPLFDTVFAVQNTSNRENRLPGLQVKPYSYGARTSKFDIDFNVYEPREGILFNVYYCTKLFRNETIEQLCRHFINVLEETVHFPGKKLHEIQVLSKVEEERLLYEFNNTEADYPKGITIHQLFERQVEKTPDRIAVIGPSISVFDKSPLYESSPSNLQITYRELNEKSNRLAIRLREKGVVPDTIVGIKIERSTLMMIGIVGILKAGGAYLPIDPDYPRERMDFMLKDSGAKILLKKSEIRISKYETNPNDQKINVPTKNFKDLMVLDFEHLNFSSLIGDPRRRFSNFEFFASEGDLNSSNLAYIIYTSGTTGKPKGVMIEHRSLVNRLNWMQKAYPLAERDTLLQKTTFTFDVSVWEIFWWALAGAKVCLLAHGGEKDPGIITTTIEKHHPSVIHFVPSMLSVFLDYLKQEGDARKLPSLKQVITSGEELTVAQVRRFEEILGKINFTKLANLYGPTEAAIDVSYYNCFETTDLQEIPIGKPIDNIKLWIIDRYLHLQPVMVPGELCIFGVGLARGYLNRLELTADKFIELGEHGKAYRTGDLARWLPDGNIEFLGRIDHQVKIRGFRIECGEIEYELIKYKGIDQAVVIAGESEGGEYKYLCAYIVSKEDLHMEVLREYLVQKLPDYMIPHYFVKLENIPLTPNGKVDRARLPEPGIDIELRGEYIPPADKIQEKLVEIWQQVLHVGLVGIKDNYFHLGGDSIKAIALISAINNEFHSNLNMANIYIDKTVERLSLKLKEKDIQSDGELKELLPEIEEFKHRVLKIVDDPDNIEDVFPMSAIEMGMIFHYVKGGEEALYHDQVVYQIVYNDFDIERMRKALNLMVEKHPILRTAYHHEAFAHIVYRSVPLDIPFHDISGMDKPGKEAFILRYMEESRGRSFDIQAAPLWRMSFFNPGIDNRIILLSETHHAIIDGWSNALLLTELNNTYLELRENSGYVPQKLKSGYKDYILQQMLEKRKPGTADYWKNELSGYKRLNLPTRMESKTGKNEEKTGVEIKTRDLGGQRREKLENTARKYNTTLKHLCFAAYSLMLGMMSYENDILVGLVTHSRPLSEDGDKIVGCFLNSIPVRIKIPVHTRWSDFFTWIDGKMMTLKQYDQLPLLEIVSLLGEKTGEGNPLFDTLFNFVDFHAYKQVKVETNAENKQGDDQVNVGSFEKTNFPLSLTIDALMGRFITRFNYSEDIFNEEYVRKLHGYFENILDQFIDNPEGILNKGIIISEVEKRELLYGFNDTKVDFPQDLTIHQVFEAQVEKTPDYIALIGLTDVSTAEAAHLGTLTNVNASSSPFAQITYRQLNGKSDQLASLLKEEGVRTDTIVAVMFERSIEMIIGILGVLKSGGAYLPIDPEYPEERIDYMLKDSGAKLLVTSNNLEGVRKFGSKKVKKNNGTTIFVNIMVLEELPNFLTSFPPNFTLLPASSHRPPATSLAYIIYTSGSTGKPKGVMVEHGNLANLVGGLSREIYMRYDQKLNICLVSPYIFDASIKQIFAALLLGHTLNIVPERVRLDGKLLLQYLKEYNIDISDGTPSHLRLFIESMTKDLLPVNVKHFIIGGEALTQDIAEGFFNKFGGKAPGIINIYGPTECTVDTTFFELSYENIHLFKMNIPIGKPMPNCRVYIVDKFERLQPIGIPGELLVGGNGVGRGYLGKQELTSDKFVFDPFIERNGMDNPMMYRTGDLARWLPDGNIEFLGRIDNQVKIRGYRIESGEIESCLLKVSGVKETVVLGREEVGGNKYLCAYIVSEHDILLPELREYLLKYLPDYMIPSYFVRLDKIPITPNGKIDRKALPEPEGISLRDDSNYIPPSSAVEKKLAEIWEKVLGRTNIGIHENFFHVGGDSIKSIQIISRMSNAGFKLEMKDLFKYPVISELAPHVKKLKRIPDQSVIKGTILLSPIQKMFFNRSLIDQNNVHHCNHFNQAVMFYAKDGFDKEVIKAVFTKIQEHHDALRMTYKINRENGEVIQIDHGLDYPLSIEEYDLRNIESGFEELQKKLNGIQASIDLEKGPMMKLGLFHLNDGGRLLIAIHHLVVDGVSWRILLEDIDILFQQYRRGEPLVLPLKSDSFKRWAEMLSEYADSESFLKEKAYWAELDSREVPLIENDFQEEENFTRDLETSTFTLDKEETGLLLTKVNHAFGTEINDILLTALGLGIKETFGNKQLLIAMEGHGREDIFTDLDISRTVGWFTSLYPVLLDFSYGNDLSRQIKEVKESLRRVPHKGFGYGILKYLTSKKHLGELKFRLKPQIIFNYLGRFDEDIENKSFAIAEESPGKTRSIHQHMEFELELSGIVAVKRLRISITYNTKQYKRETMDSLIDYYKKALSHIILFCSFREKKELTPSDFTYSELSIEALRQLQEKYSYSIEDINILTPMQTGKLFYTLYDSSTSGGSVQMTADISGKLDLSLFERSINELLKRYDILRTAFVYGEVEVPVQIVLKERRVDFLYEDFRKNSTGEDKSAVIDEFVKKDRKRPFDLAKDVLMRVVLLQTGDTDYMFIWSYHHILMDGWCLGILFREFLEIYNSFAANRPYKLQRIQPYKKFLQWLIKQNEMEPEVYWKRYLDGYDRKTGIPKRQGVKENKNGYKLEKIPFILNETKTSRLQALAARSQVTLNTIFQTIWGIILSKYNQQEDVVFGTVVSGRPTDLPGVESMVGLFINTIPIRVSCKPGTTFRELARQVQAKAVEGETYHHFSLSRIQAVSILKQNLLDHVLVFENYPLAEQVEGIVEISPDRPFDITVTSDFTQPDYNLHMVIQPGDSLTFEFRINTWVYDSNFIKELGLQVEELIDAVLNDSDTLLENIRISDKRPKARPHAREKYIEDFGF